MASIKEVRAEIESEIPVLSLSRLANFLNCSAARLNIKLPSGSVCMASREEIVEYRVHSRIAADETGFSRTWFTREHDTDGDGVISFQELKNLPATEIGRLLARTADDLVTKRTEEEKRCARSLVLKLPQGLLLEVLSPRNGFPNDQRVIEAGILNELARRDPARIARFILSESFREPKREEPRFLRRTAVAIFEALDPKNRVAVQRDLIRENRGEAAAIETDRKKIKQEKDVRDHKMKVCDNLRARDELECDLLLATF